ncbi:MAG: serine hydrolase domain-containing protein, partial [Candidatus Hydrogenedentales bacterium]
MYGITKIFVATLLLSSTAVAQHEEIVRGDVGATLDAVYEAAEADGFAGAVLIARDGEILLQKGYGLANRETETSWPPATISTIGSITKTFTAVALMKLASEDKLAVDDPITKYFDDVPEDKQHITLHHLLTHSAGLRGAHGGDFDKRATRDELLERAMKSDLLWGADMAGERYEYSNTGYSLLAMIVEDLSGKPYEDYVRAAILEPAGMTDTGYTLDWDPSRFAHGYQNDNETGV